MLAKNVGSRDINDRLEIFSHRKGHQHDHFALIILKIVTNIKPPTSIKPRYSQNKYIFKYYLFKLV